MTHVRPSAEVATAFPVMLNDVHVLPELVDMRVPPLPVAPKKVPSAEDATDRQLSAVPVDVQVDPELVEINIVSP